MRNAQQCAFFWLHCAYVTAINSAIAELASRGRVIIAHGSFVLREILPERVSKIEYRRRENIYRQSAHLSTN
jgi:hypothetical protein